MLQVAGIFHPINLLDKAVVFGILFFVSLSLEFMKIQRVALPSFKKPPCHEQTTEVGNIYLCDFTPATNGVISSSRLCLYVRFYASN